MVLFRTLSAPAVSVSRVSVPIPIPIPVPIAVPIPISAAAAVPFTLPITLADVGRVLVIIQVNETQARIPLTDLTLTLLFIRLLRVGVSGSAAVSCINIW